MEPSIIEKMKELQYCNNLMWECVNLENQLKQRPMANQFFYTLEYKAAPTEGKGEPINVTRMASFNVDKVIRSVETEEGKLIVILDDFHEETRQTVKNNANGKAIVGTEKVMLQSEIHLNEEDKFRFRRTCSVYEPLNFNTEVLQENGV